MPSRAHRFDIVTDIGGLELKQWGGEELQILAQRLPIPIVVVCLELVESQVDRSVLILTTNVELGAQVGNGTSELGRFRESGVQLYQVANVIASCELVHQL